MEFLVRIEVRLPTELDGETRRQLTARELARGKALQAEGSIVRIWRVPGRHANVAVWRAADPSELHELLTSLPLHPWMDVDVQALALHPLEVSEGDHEKP
jgi:muconolactone D-isomerase